MKKLILTLSLTFAVAMLFAQGQPLLWSGFAGGNPAHKPPQSPPADDLQIVPADPLLLSQGPDCNATGSSEVIGAYNLTSNCADDFMFTTGKNITAAGWWFAPFNGAYSSFATWTVTIYNEAACLPGNIVQQWIIPFNMSHELLYCTNGYYSYWADLTPSFIALANTKYWVSVQTGDHVFPGQWGWAMHAQVSGCQGAFKSDFFGFPDYVPAGGLVFVNPTDFAFELYGTGSGIVETPIPNWALFIGIGLILVATLVRFRRLI
jgi:hypothetical protein